MFLALIWKKKIENCECIRILLLSLLHNRVRMRNNIKRINDIPFIDRDIQGMCTVSDTSWSHSCVAPLPFLQWRDVRECRQRVRLERGVGGYFWVSVSALTAEAFAFYVSRVCQEQDHRQLVRAIHSGSHTHDAFPRSSLLGHSQDGSINPIVITSRKMMRRDNFELARAAKHVFLD